MTKKYGFTLLEIIVVMSITIMLASTIIGAGMYAYKIAQEEGTKGMIATIGLALVNYSSDYNGQYPPSHVLVDGDDSTVDSGKAGIQALCTYLFKSEEFVDLRPLGKPDSYAEPQDFFGEKIALHAIGTVNYLKDSWGVPFFYYCPGAPSRNAASYDLFSAGPDTRTPAQIFEIRDDELKMVFDYKEDAKPYEYIDGEMQAISDATGAVDEIKIFKYVVKNDGDDKENFGLTMDDLGNWKRIRAVGF